MKNVFIMFIILSLSPVCYAEKNCDALVYSCTEALKAKDVAIDAAKGVIVVQDDVNRLLNERVVQLESSKSAIWNNPFVLIGLGVIGGFVLAK